MKSISLWWDNDLLSSTVVAERQQRGRFACKCTRKWFCSNSEAPCPFFTSWCVCLDTSEHTEQHIPARIKQIQFNSNEIRNFTASYIADCQRRNWLIMTDALILWARTVTETSLTLKLEWDVRKGVFGLISHAVRHYMSMLTLYIIKSLLWTHILQRGQTSSFVSLQQDYMLIPPSCWEGHTVWQASMCQCEIIPQLHASSQMAPSKTAR